MQVDWTRQPQNRLEFSLCTKCFRELINFFGQFQDAVVRQRYDGRENTRKLRLVITPIILAAHDAGEAGDAVTLAADDVPQEFLDRHEIDWAYVSHAISGLMTVGAIEFIRVGSDGDQYEFKAGPLLGEASREPEEQASEEQVTESGWTYRRPTSDNLQHFRWLKKEFELSDLFDDFISPMAEAVQQHAGIPLTRRQSLEDTKQALRVLIGNLYRAYQLEPNLFVTVRNRPDGGWEQNGYNPLAIGYRAVNRCINYMLEANPPLLDTRGGNRIKLTEGDQDTGADIRIATRVRVTEVILYDIYQYLSDLYSNLIDGSFCITGNTSPEDSPFSPQATQLFNDHPLPSVRLKDENKKLIEFDPTPETEGMVANLMAINSFIKDHHWIDILIPDAEFDGLLSGTADNDEEEFGDRDERKASPDLLYDRRLYRVFNNGDFTQGGRFYGGWWQSIKSEYRKRITINWYPTVEIDYSEMQVAMLYAQGGEQLEGAAYALDGVPDQYRKLLKRSMFKLVNATGQMRAPKAAELPPGWTWKRLLEALQEKHQPIARHFRTGIGIQLQRKDSDIAERVMLTLKDEGILALPVHDSFIVRECYEDRLKEVMLESYEQVMGQAIDVEQEPSWIKLSREQIRLDYLGVRSLDEDLSDIEYSPEYSGYLERKFRVMRHLGDGWLYTHQWFN